MDPQVEPSAPVAAAESHGVPVRFFAGKAWFWAPIVPFVVLDLWSKAAAFAFLAETQSGRAEIYREHPVVQEPFGFSLVAWTNRGTIWGLGKDFNLALIGLRFVAMGLLVFFAAKTRARDRLQQFVLGLIMAGALGNLYDNLFCKDRAVRDFLKFYWPHDDGTQSIFPAFNVADSCICVGAITLAFLLWREDRAGAPTAASSRDNSTSA